VNLDESLRALEIEGSKYPGKRSSFIADFALYAFATDVREHAIAVQLLSKSPVPRSSFTNARASLESAIDAAFMVSDQQAYLYRGAQARVAELFEIDELENRTTGFDVPLPKKSPARMHPEEAIIADAKAWDEEFPGNGDYLRRAWECFSKDPGAVRKHWSLMTKDDLYKTVFPGAEASEVGGMTEIIHALLSMASHPRMRAGSRDVEYTDDGGILLSTRRTDGEMARNVAAVACTLAVSSLQKRRGFDLAPPNTR
jgi:hypothetical protein